ncbi:MAG: 3-keto-5-aminohexanoate cleavage protein [Pseudomonadota bacterium]|nr:3-keto-5-aminohexanoate cleavage protein [Pseudomonadota bacterium]
MGKVWIEVALNGPWGRARQPGAPDEVAEIVAQGVACARAGAAIVHAHAYDGGGPQTFDWQVYARIIEGIRAQIDVPVYPSIPMGGGLAPQARFAHIAALAERGLLEFAVVDPGSVNFTTLEPGGEPAPTYLNSEADIRCGLTLAVEHGFHPAFAIYEPGFTRAGAALARMLRTKAPIYRFMFSQTFAFGFPPEPFALDAHLALLDREAPGAPWMIAGLGVDVTALIPRAVSLGGHVRVGLEDAPFGCAQSNVALVEDAVARVRAAGAEPATVAQMRAALGGAPLAGARGLA